MSHRDGTVLYLFEIYKVGWSCLLSTLGRMYKNTVTFNPPYSDLQLHKLWMTEIWIYWIKTFATYFCNNMRFLLNQIYDSTYALFVNMLYLNFLIFFYFVNFICELCLTKKKVICLSFFFLKGHNGESPGCCLHIQIFYCGECIKNDFW